MNSCTQYIVVQEYICIYAFIKRLHFLGGSLWKPLYSFWCPHSLLVTKSINLNTMFAIKILYHTTADISWLSKKIAQGSFLLIVKEWDSVLRVFWFVCLFVFQLQELQYCCFWKCCVNNCLKKRISSILYTPFTRSVSCKDYFLGIFLKLR